MVDNRVGRRTLLGVGVGLLSSLAGCSGLFIEPEPTTTTTPDGTRTRTGTPTPTPTAADTAGSTARATSTAAPLPNDIIEVRNHTLAVRRSPLETVAFVDYRFDVENVGGRTIRDVEFRVDVRYEHEDVSRIVATDVHRFVFDPRAETDDEGDVGLQVDETRRIRETVRFERDGRDEDWMDTERYDLELAVRRIRYR
ncbi:hypothetical protein EI982_15570 [Haloplanus rallus]|uniref:Uncharacterized protein n=1 Tax=Haloplanus rallus TaxID=1816183 RepID=A0A6B9F6F3_9EURY|nr:MULTISPECIES: hypothetical protein [Haloplanus]QGX96096.1 hypothetical protein EI982_15570 [Haloplanus rallus]